VFAIRHEAERLEAMDTWNRNQHRRSGLWDQVLNSSETDHADGRAGDGEFPQAMGDARQVADVRQLDLPGPSLHASADAAAGAFFHYRNLDVSTLKELARRWAPMIGRASARNRRIRPCRISAIPSTSCVTTASSWASSVARSK
jgi:oligoribonuclease